MMIPQAHDFFSFPYFNLTSLDEFGHESWPFLYCVLLLTLQLVGEDGLNLLFAFGVAGCLMGYCKVTNVKKNMR
jgi:hypothetical protein